MLSKFCRTTVFVSRRVSFRPASTSAAEVDFSNPTAIPAVVTAKPGPEAPLPVSFQDITLAMYRIQSGVKRTHCDYSQFLSELCDCEIYLKKDFTQFTGSFKERGGRNALMLLNAENRKNGVVAASAGNHALALAWHGRDLNIPVTCVMPASAPMAKVDKCRKFGANVVLHGEHIGEAKKFALQEFAHLKYINGYDDPEIIAGAGTMGIEILDQAKDVDVILVPIGGAGLIAGVSLAAKTIKPTIQVIGVEPANVASYAAAIAAGKPVDGFKEATIADGLAVPVVGPTSFEVARRFVDSSCVVSEKEIALAMLRLIEMEKVVVEGGGAAALAAILPEGPLYGHFRGKKVCVLLCGGNIDTSVLGRVIDRGLSADSRLIRFGATVSDRPGGIARLAKDMAELGASVKDIHHERAWLHSRIDQVVVKCVVETTGKVHADHIIRSLRERGYPISREDPHSQIHHDGSWSYHNRVPAKYNPWKTCPQTDELVLADKFLLDEKRKFSCEDRHYRKAVFQTPSCKFLRLEETSKLMIQHNFTVAYAGDSLPAQLYTNAMCSAETHGFSMASHTHFLHDIFLRNDIPCDDRCLTNTTFLEQKAFKHPCWGCRNGTRYDYHAYLQDPKTWHNRAAAMNVSALVVGNGAWYNSFQGIINSTSTYIETLQTTGPILKNLHEQYGMHIFWLGLVPPNVDVTKMNETDYGYEWIHFEEKDALAKSILEPYGVTFIDTNMLLKTRKKLDPWVSADGMHWCNPGIDAAPAFLNRVIFHLLAVRAGLVQDARREAQ